mmetsp:Transcript_65229/g.201951  ORF Transcript_65229/g.201951 Transcript_65229/m.201951 type:complete len:541 (+) Transcript_65229:386-2008(+)
MGRRGLARRDGLGRLRGGEDLVALDEGALGLLGLPEGLLGPGQLRPRLAREDAAESALAGLPRQLPGPGEAGPERLLLHQEPLHRVAQSAVRVRRQRLRGRAPGGERSPGVPQPQGGGLLGLLRGLLLPERQGLQLGLRDEPLQRGELLPLLLQEPAAALRLPGGPPQARERGLRGLQAPGELRKLRAEGRRGPAPGVLPLRRQRSARRLAGRREGLCTLEDLGADLAQLLYVDALEIVLGKRSSGFGSLLCLLLRLGHGFDNLNHLHLGPARKDINLELRHPEAHRVHPRLEPLEILRGLEPQHPLRKLSGLHQPLHQEGLRCLQGRQGLRRKRLGRSERRGRLRLGQDLCAPSPGRLRLLDAPEPSLRALRLLGGDARERAAQLLAPLAAGPVPELLRAALGGQGALADSREPLPEGTCGGAGAGCAALLQEPEDLGHGGVDGAKRRLRGAGGILRGGSTAECALHTLEVGLNRGHPAGESLELVLRPQLLLELGPDGLVGVELLLRVDQPPPHWRHLCEGSLLLLGGQQARRPDLRI